jgi:hypothetical protein
VKLRLDKLERFGVICNRENKKAFFEAWQFHSRGSR